MSCYRSSTGTPLDTDSSNFQRRLHRYGCIRHCSCRIHLHLKKTMVLGKKVIAHHVSPFSAKWNPVIWHILHWSLVLLVNTPKWLTAWENLVESGWPTDLLDDGHDARFALISWHTSQGANKTSSRDYNKHLSHTCDLNVWLSCNLGSQAGVLNINHAFHLHYKCMWIEFQSISTWLRGFPPGTPVSSLLKIDS